LQTHFGFFVSFVNDVEPKVAQRASHQFSDAEASRSKGVVAEFVQRWKGLVETVNASISTGGTVPVSFRLHMTTCCRMQLQREDIGRRTQAVPDAAPFVRVPVFWL
jgi:hypothetical protein